MNGLGFKLYLFFTISWHLHLASRIPFLGSLRIDLLLALILIVMTLIIRYGKEKKENKEIEGILTLLRSCVVPPLNCHMTTASSMR